MSELLSPDNPELKRRLWPKFREFFRRAERKRRWNVDEDIPWDTASLATSPAIAAIVESFCAVELYLPDYVAKALPMIRTNRAWAWTHVNWGYEEAKHSIALGDWLVRSGHRSEEYMADLETRLFQHEWNLPQESGAGMLIYAMVQELATWLCYRNLRNHVQPDEDPALRAVLGYLQIDERAHHSYYKEITDLFLEVDRKGTIELLKRVLAGFSMPAIHVFAETQQLKADIEAMNIFSEEIFYRDIYLTVLEILGISRAEMRAPRTPKLPPPSSLVA
jgi:acyl-[acyl-carrier-protein] desaturase